VQSSGARKTQQAAPVFGIYKSLNSTHGNYIQKRSPRKSYEYLLAFTPSEKWTPERRYRINPLQSIDQFYTDLCLTCMGIRGGQLSFEIAALTKRSYPHHWQFTKAQTNSYVAFKVPYIFDFVTKLCRQ